VSESTAVTYYVFTRAWWRDAGPHDGRWPNNLVPNSGGRKTTLETGLTRDEAIEYCREYNATHDPGRYSRKAEFSEE
jgi:hypothetical protein